MKMNNTLKMNNILKLLRKVNVLTDLTNVKDCHRLKSNSNAPQKVIIKFKKLFTVFSRLNRTLKILMLPKIEFP